MAERFPWCLRSNLAWFGGMISRNSLMPWFFFASWSCSDLLWLLLFYSGLCVRPCFLVSRAHTCVHYSKMISPIRWYYGIPESKYQHSPYFKKSMLVNHNDIHALNQQLLKVMYIFQNNLPPSNRRSLPSYPGSRLSHPTHPPAIEAWIPCLPWNSAIAWVPNFRPWICPIRVLLAGRDKHGVSIWICMYMSSGRPLGGVGCRDFAQYISSLHKNIFPPHIM